MAVSLTGTPHIDALLIPASWTGNTGESANVSYSFKANVTDTAFMNSVVLGLQAWADIANVTFQNINDPTSAPLLFDYKDIGDSQTAGLTSFSGFVDQTDNLTLMITNADVDVSNTLHPLSELAVGQDGYITVLHEIGHALGLEHPFEGVATITPPLESFDGTIMSYNEGGSNFVVGLPTTPMLFDIATIQYLYGANTSFASGDNTYSFTGNNEAQTIWDGGGNDTIMQASSAGRVRLDLREGFDNVNTVGTSAFWMAFGANIENATAGAGSDEVFGNGLNNSLIGNAGADTIKGFAGNDTLLGGSEADSLQGNQGSDSVNGNAGADSVRGGKDDDTVHGGKDNDTVKGDIGNDEVSGDLGNDTVRGGQNEDTLFGNDGNDSLFGDLGNDTLTGGNGSDTFVFNTSSGVDVITDFVVGQDFIRIFSSVIGSTADAVNAFSNGVLDLGGGNTVTITGIASLTEADFVIT